MPSRATSRIFDRSRAFVRVYFPRAGVRATEGAGRKGYFVHDGTGVAIGPEAKCWGSAWRVAEAAMRKMLEAR
jgi:hypothetical protein